MNYILLSSMNGWPKPIKGPDPLSAEDIMELSLELGDSEWTVSSLSDTEPIFLVGAQLYQFIVHSL